MSKLRLALVAILVLSTAVFAAGVITERSEGSERAESASAHEEAGAGSAPAEEEPAGEAHADEGEVVLGIDVESTALIILAIIAGFGLAAIVATGLGRAPAVLLVIALIAFVWAALDIREVVHQLDGSRGGIAVVAAITAVLHLGAAALAGTLAARARHSRSGSTGPAGTMPA